MNRTVNGPKNIYTNQKIDKGDIMEYNKMEELVQASPILDTVDCYKRQCHAEYTMAWNYILYRLTSTIMEIRYLVRTTR